MSTADPDLENVVSSMLDNLQKEKDQVEWLKKKLELAQQQLAQKLKEIDMSRNAQQGKLHILPVQKKQNPNSLKLQENCKLDSGIFSSDNNLLSPSPHKKRTVFFHKDTQSPK